jgi:hypothetical protein
MKAFRFPLERVMQWRKVQLDLEHSTLRLRIEELRQLAAAKDLLERAIHQSEAKLRDRTNLTGSDLNAQGNFLRASAAKRSDLAQKVRSCEERVRIQRKKYQEAQRNFRLLEMLKADRRQEWSRAFDKELEDLAAESHLAQLGMTGRG